MRTQSGIGSGLSEQPCGLRRWRRRGVHGWCGKPHGAMALPSRWTVSTAVSFPCHDRVWVRKLIWVVSWRCWSEQSLGGPGPLRRCRMGEGAFRAKAGQQLVNRRSQGQGSEVIGWSTFGLRILPHKTFSPRGVLTPLDVLVSKWHVGDILGPLSSCWLTFSYRSVQSRAQKIPEISPLAQEHPHSEGL